MYQALSCQHPVKTSAKWIRRARGTGICLCLFLSLGISCIGSDSPDKAPPQRKPASDAVSEQDSGDGSKGQLNAVGRVDSEKGESRRNENIQFNLIDNHGLQELMGRIGLTATIVSEFKVDRSYFGAEFGQEAPSSIHLQSENPFPLHGTLRYLHNNSIFNARSFFQVGGVKPARENSYGFSGTLPIWRNTWLSLEGNQRKLRGSVNGNVLVLLPTERTPLTTDPVLLPVVMRYLAAWPDQLPNRTDVNPRMLNTNAPQTANDDRVAIRLDRNASPRERLVLSYRFSLQKVDAFQLVAGQNPDTTLRVHTARATWNRQWSPSTQVKFSVGLDRMGSLLVPDKTAVGPKVGVGGLTGLGPMPDIPIDRADTSLRYAAELSRGSGDHALIMGIETARQQSNGIETMDNRGARSLSATTMAGTRSQICAWESRHRFMARSDPSIVDIA
jgi:hypothetical protein